MKVPDSASYKDVSRRVVLPPLTLEIFNDYLSQSDILSLDEREKLYEAHFLKTFRATLDNGFYFVRRVCRAEMKKHTTYTVDVKLNAEYYVEECNCECAAGWGPNARGKHMRAVLNAALDFVNIAEVL